MALHAFVDESFRRSDYVLVAAAVTVQDLDTARKMLRQLAKGNRVHMAKENPRRRREIVSRLGGSGLIRATIVTAELGSGSQRAARDACIAELIPRVVGDGVDRLVVESCDQDARDRAAIGRSLNDGGLTGRLTYLFQRPGDEVLLAAADVVAWAYGARGEWRRRIEPIIGSVTECR